ncbi:hypothetical protein RhiJN_24354 [Ceratobasidium sp. AG-Ba]|nr:hypothetical protein RhiJN_24354 [Ceratobasidium sp. AG-Ba]
MMFGTGQALRYGRHANDTTHNYHHLRLPSLFYRTMSETPDAGRGKRTITRTPGGRDFAKQISDLDVAQEKRARKKEIQRQEAILAAEDSTDDDDEIAIPRKKSKSSKSSSKSSKSSSKLSKSSSKSTKSSKSSKQGSNPKAPLETVDEDNDLTSAEAGHADQSRRNFLINQIHGRDKAAISKLKTKETWELEYQWSKGKPPAPPQIKDRPVLKPVAKTPMWKSSSSLPIESSFDVLGLPIIALRAAEDQSEKALQSTPGPASHKRDYNANGEEIHAKRSRISPPSLKVNQNKQGIPAKPSATVRPFSSNPAIPASTPSETQASKGDAVSGRSSAQDTSSKPPVPAHKANHTALEGIEDDAEMIMLDASDTVDASAQKNPKRSKKSSSEEKVSNKKLTRDYEGTENSMINQTLWIVVSRLGSEGFFPALLSTSE